MADTVINDANAVIAPEFTLTCVCGSTAVGMTVSPKVLYGSLHAHIGLRLECHKCGLSVVFDKGVKKTRRKAAPA